MKYPRHEHVRRSILLQEPRDRDLTDEDLEEMRHIEVDIGYLRAAYDSQHNNLTDKVIKNSESDGIQPASPSIVR